MSMTASATAFAALFEGEAAAFGGCSRTLFAFCAAP